ncbi:MAG: homoserine O-succinyltransferase MetX, partial [Longimicrobiales bacterium]
MSTVLHAPERRAAGDVVEIRALHGTHGVLHGVRIAYRVYGDDDAPAVLVLGGISATRELLARAGQPGSGWWPGVVGERCALDPAAFRLIGIDYLGGRGASSGPAHDGAWPALTTADQAQAITHVLDHLGIDRLHAVIGASYGGMVALALAAHAPERVERVIALCAAHRPHPLATAWRSVQRRIVRLGLRAGASADAVGVARALAITTYRTGEEFGLRFERVASGAAPTRFPVDDYLDRHADRYAAEVAAESLLTLSESLDLHCVDPAAIRAPCTLVAFDSDVLVPPADVRALAGALSARTRTHTVRTLHGHDGFLKETAAVAGILRTALAESLDVAICDDPARSASGHAARVASDATVRGAATIAARAGIGADAHHGAVIAPIHLSSTFSFEGLERKRRYDYTRSGNPTRDTLAATIAALEHGAAGVVTATGMAAITATLHLLRPGDLLLAAHDGYGGTHRLVTALARRGA